MNRFHNAFQPDRYEADIRFGSDDLHAALWTQHPRIMRRLGAKPNARIFTVSQ